MKLTTRTGFAMRRTHMVGDLLNMSIKCPTPEGLIGLKAPNNFTGSPNHETSCKWRTSVWVCVQNQPTRRLSISCYLYCLKANLAALGSNQSIFAVRVHNMCLILSVCIDARHRVL